MPNEMETATSNFSEQAKKLQVALYYTYGDEERAKKMISGTYSDLYVLKGRFSSSSLYGAFVLFINTIYFKPVSSYILVSRSFDLADLKTAQDWRNFEKQLVDVSKKGGYDESFSSQIKDGINKGLTLQEISTFSKQLAQDDGIAVSHSFQKFLGVVTNLQNLN